MASHLASLWKWDFLELGNGLFTLHSAFFLISPRPTIWNCWVLRTGTRRYKTSQSKGENQQQTQRSSSVTSGGIRTQGLLIGAAPHISFHLRFPIEQKKNFLFTRDLFYRLLSQYFLFSTCFPCKQTNRNLRMWNFFSPPCQARFAMVPGTNQRTNWTEEKFSFYPRFILSFIKPIFSFLHMFSLQTNKSEFAHVEFFFSPLSGTVRNGTWDESAHQLKL